MNIPKWKCPNWAQSVNILCGQTFSIFQHYLNPLGHGVNQSFTGCHWVPLPLLHDDIPELVDFRDLALLHLPFEDVPTITLPSASLARQWSSWRCVWGRYHVGILPYGPVSEGRRSCSASVCYNTCWNSWFPQWPVAPQCRQHSCSPRPRHSHHHAWL